MSETSWTLDRYARCVYNNTKKDGNWKLFDGPKSLLIMTLTDMNQLIISQDTTVLESHSLASARQWMWGVSHKDELVFMHKFKSGIRKFRVKFCKQKDKTGLEICASAVQQLSQFFPIKTKTTGTSGAGKATQAAQTTTAGEKSNSASSQSNPVDLLALDKEMKSADDVPIHGEVTFSTMAKAVLDGKSLPVAYQQHHIDPQTIPQLVRICLADPAFPAFVGSVEAALKNIVDGSS